MSEKIAVIDYGAGNLRSVAKAFERVANEGARRVEICVTADAETARGADRIVLPGVGAFAACRDGLAALPGMIEAIGEAVIDKGRPFFGVCVGMQLMASRGLEYGETPGLDWVAGSVRRFEMTDDAFRVPHIGWNNVTVRAEHPAFDALPDRTDFYFVHSFHLDTENPEHVIAECDYGAPFAAAVGRDNMLGVQFHPEKSQAAGLALIDGFLRWAP